MPSRPDIRRLGPPIDTRPCLPTELNALLAPLRGLRPTDWRKAALPRSTVHDLAAHVLGDYYGRLGLTRDGYRHVARPGEG
ncbi:hypothetical protein [Streptomyces sp. NPDC057877]|uniref:hypothetical protein n=1 Tax=Streptomyces sp. NPDC057877 TaxID=3346269 RepID=UPI00368B6EF1